MSCTQKTALAGTMFVALAFAVSQTTAAPAAHTHTHTHTSAANTQSAKPKTKPITKLKTTPHETVIYVKDLHCKHCAKKIASKLYAVKGVVKVRTDLKADVAIVTPQSKKKLDPLALWSAANKSGFPAIKLVGPTGTYVLNPKTKAAQLEPKKSVTPKS